MYVRFLLSFLAALVQQNILTEVNVTFLLVGHTVSKHLGFWAYLSQSWVTILKLVCRELLYRAWLIYNRAFGSYVTPKIAFSLPSHESPSWDCTPPHARSIMTMWNELLLTSFMTTLLVEPRTGSRRRRGRKLEENLEERWSKEGKGKSLNLQKQMPWWIAQWTWAIIPVRLTPWWWRWWTSCTTHLRVRPIHPDSIDLNASSEIALDEDFVET